MALISCPECGKGNISDSAIACPNCGFGVKEYFQKIEMEKQAEIRRQEVEKQRILLEEERKKAEKLKEERRIKSKKIISKVAIISFIAFIVILLVIKIVNVCLFGLSKEEKKSYAIAQSNYKKIDNFTMSLSLDFHDECKKYTDDTSKYGEKKNNLSEAEKNKDYLYSRSIYGASAKLYGLIEYQYPEQYSDTYKRLSQVRASDIFNDIKLEESFYVKNDVNSSIYDKSKELDEEISNLERYMGKTVLNPKSVKYKMTSLPGTDYSKVYGISMGIILYDDGNIMYLGEMSGGVPHGNGIAWYSAEKGGGTMCEGSFSNGIFLNGRHYGTDGNTNDIEETKEFSFLGKVLTASGLNNTSSNSEIADKNASEEKKDKEDAVACAQEYINDVVNKRNGCDKIEWSAVPSIKSSKYVFSCTCTLSDGSKKKGQLTVKKNYDGTFSAVGIELD